MSEVGVLKQESQTAKSSDLSGSIYADPTHNVSCCVRHLSLCCNNAEDKDNIDHPISYIKIQNRKTVLLQ